MEKNEIPKINNNIKPISMYDEMSSSYLSYAMSVIVSRALPDIRDGLKPVHRRIIYAMHKGGFDWSKQFRKSARIVGDVIGKYHPHGDQAVYDALVRMVQEFSMSLPLVDGQGNFGSIDGDPPAAMRYTETKLAKVSQFLIDDIEKNTVSFKSNYDETEQEPIVLPAQYPNLLVTSGFFDSQVQYWEPLKYIAKLRDFWQGNNKLYLYMNMDAGHGGKSGRFRIYKEIALEYAFLLDLINIKT